MEDQFFSLLFKDLKGVIEIREFDVADGKDDFKTFKNYKQLSLYTPPRDKNVYFGLYTRGRKWKGYKIDGTEDNCLFTKAIYLDFDGKSLSEITEILHKEKIPAPSIIVSSGNGYHCYWLLNKPMFDITNLVKAMQKATGSDPNAAERARIFRFPGTINHKYSPARTCKIIEINDSVYDITEFLELFPVQVFSDKKKHFSNTIRIGENDIPMYCVKQMLKGVPDGFRHFSLGRITKWFQKEGYKHENVRQTVLEWNQSCIPPLPEKDLLSSFYKYWITPYKLLGCYIEDVTTQAKLSRLCDRKKCYFPLKDTKIDFSKSIEIRNTFFKGYSKKKGQELIIYGVLLRHSEGLTTSQLVSKLTSKATGKVCVGKDNRREALKTLKSLGLIEKVPACRKYGEEDFYRVIKGGCFGLGFTILSNGAINGAIDGRVTPQLLKVYALLWKYGWKGKATPSLDTLSKEIGVSASCISQHLNNLEECDYIKREYFPNRKGALKLRMKLLV